MTGIKQIMWLFFALFIVAGVAMIYQKNWAKRHPDAIQLAARADLDMIRQAQNSFYARYGTYTTDLVSLAIKPKFVYYKVGFLIPATVTAEVPNHNPAVKDLDLLKASQKIRYAEETKLDSLNFDGLVQFCSDCTATKDTYKAIAAANLDEDEALDVWTIDQSGNVTHIQDDLRN